MQANIEQPIKPSINFGGFRQSRLIKRIQRQPALLLAYVILIAYAFVSLYPILWVYLIFQRQFIQGLTAGALKG